ncbi:MAG: prepilin-type N-terminal cleavage/methylation domain-containing protein [Acidobacteriota bacterium]|nr:prepilin-type N-terminal cleavage/methylation domain-containing protein [Acidobacteriota bacterium]
MRRPKPARGRRGFTLIESLIGIVILGIAVLGLAQIFLVGVANNRRAGDIGHATFLAQQRIDYLRTLTAGELEAFPSSARGESSDEALDVNSDGTNEFRRLTRIQVSGLIFSVKVLVFPSTRIGTAADTLLADPWDYGVRAVLNTVIGR